MVKLIFNAMRNILAQALTEAKVVDILLILLYCTVNQVNQNHTAGPYADSARPSFFSDMAYKPHGSAELVQSVAFLAGIP